MRISVFSSGESDADLPTGFSADVEVIDLYDGDGAEQQHSGLSSSNAYSNVRKLVG